eukprot:9957865-Karenia_brevis.AAC.1
MAKASASENAVIDLAKAQPKIFMGKRNASTALIGVAEPTPMCMPRIDVHTRLEGSLSQESFSAFSPWG